MRALVSTTIAHNPGDELIFEGIKTLLEGRVREWVFYNRNPDLQHSGLRIQKNNLIGNYASNNIDLNTVDVVIQAGSPEFFGPPLQTLYEALDKHPKPFWVLGVGNGLEDNKLSELDATVLGAAKILTVRSDETESWLRECNINVDASLPCPSVLYQKKIKVSGNKKLLIIDKPGDGWVEVNPNYILGYPLKGYETACFHIKALNHYQDINHFVSNFEALNKLISSGRWSRVISTRLHGAIAALANGIPAVVIGSDNYRISTAARKFNGFLPCVSSIEEAMDTPTKSHSEIKEFISRLRTTYNQIVDSKI